MTQTTHGDASRPGDWFALRVEDWTAWDTLHMWLQVVGQRRSRNSLSSFLGARRAGPGCGATGFPAINL